MLPKLEHAAGHAPAPQEGLQLVQSTMFKLGAARRFRNRSRRSFSLVCESRVTAWKLDMQPDACPDSLGFPCGQLLITPANEWLKGLELGCGCSQQIVRAPV